MKLCRMCGVFKVVEPSLYCKQCETVVIGKYHQKIDKNKRLQLKDMLSDKSFKFNFLTEIGRLGG